MLELLNFILNDGFVKSFNMIVKSEPDELVDRLFELVFLVYFLSNLL